MSHTCTMHIQTHTHTFVYYNILSTRQTLPTYTWCFGPVSTSRLANTYAHTNTLARSASHAHREPCDNIIEYGFYCNNITIHIILSRVQ